MYPIELSGGMKQRMVMVISTLLEPVAADRRRDHVGARRLDAEGRRQRRSSSFRDRGFVKSMIVITHDLSILYQIADTILIMYAGKLAEKASGDDDHLVAAPPVHEGC